MSTVVFDISNERLNSLFVLFCFRFIKILKKFDFQVIHFELDCKDILNEKQLDLNYEEQRENMCVMQDRRKTAFLQDHQ